MTPTTPTRHARQVGQLRRNVALAPALPFSELLSGELAQQAIGDEAVSFRDRLRMPDLVWV